MDRMAALPDSTAGGGMKIALLGATGFVGARILAEALDRGHEVTAVVRDPSRVPVHPRLRAAACDIMRRGALADVIEGHDALISAYNPGHDIDANPHLYRDIVEGAVAIMHAMRDAGVPHLTYIGGAGSLLRRPGLFVADDPEFPDSYSVSVPRALEHFAEHKRRSTDVPLGGRATYLLFEHVRDFAWSYVSPPLFLQPGVRTGRYVEHGDTFPWNGSVPAGISLEDFAVAVLDEAERRSHVHRHFTVTAV